MGAESKIAWTDDTFNPWWGCQKVSSGCANCYAEKFAARTGHDCFGSNARRFFGAKHWVEPLKWNREAERKGVLRRVFCGSMCDWAEDRAELTEPRSQLWTLISQTPCLTWLMLTKRPDSAVKYGMRSFANLWHGTTVENQDATWRIVHLADLDSPTRFLSVEPMLGPLDLDWEGVARVARWVIFGAESNGNGPGRRCELGWVRDGVDGCRAAGIAVFVKQLHIDGRLSKDPSEWPDDLRVQEFPTVNKSILDSRSALSSYPKKCTTCDGSGMDLCRNPCGQTDAEPMVEMWVNTVSGIEYVRIGGKLHFWCERSWTPSCNSNPTSTMRQLHRSEAVALLNRIGAKVEGINQ